MEKVNLLKPVSTVEQNWRLQVGHQEKTNDRAEKKGRGDLTGGNYKEKK